MPEAMTPRERLRAAMRGEEVDYLPCSIYFNSNLRPPGGDCSTQEGRTRLALELGVDPVVSFGLRGGPGPDVTTETWEETAPGEAYPILWQAWDTPAGRLTQAVRKDPACAAWDRIHWDDAAASSLYKPLIETPDDVERFRYVFAPVRDADFEAHHASARPRVDDAHARGLPTVLVYGQGLAMLLFAMGAERAVLFAMDHRDAFEELAEIIHQVELRGIELAARLGVDILKRFGGYEQTNFYNPEIFRAVCAPRLRAEVAAAHERGLLIYYRVVTGMGPLLEDIAALGFDCIEGGEPHLSGCSLERWREAFAGKASSWTGVSSPVLLGGKDPEAVRAEVRRCVEVFGKRGYILGVTNSIRNHFHWPCALAMIDEWKRLR